MNLKERIRELQGDLVKRIVDAVQKSRQMNDADKQIRTEQGLDKPIANKYRYFSNLIEESDKQLLENALKEYTPNYSSITKNIPDFKYWIDKNLLAEATLYSIFQNLSDGLYPALGVFRTQDYGIKNSNLKLPTATDIPELIDNMRSELGNLSDTHPVEKAAEIHYNFTAIHPLVDKNGGVARVLMNLELAKEKYPALYFGEPFSPMRNLYLNALELSSWTGDYSFFQDYVLLQTMKHLNAAISTH